MRLKPLGDRVVIQRVEVEEKTESGIVLTGSAKEQPQIAEVLALGTGILEDDKKKEQLKVGDQVVFSEYAGTKVKLDGEEYTILNLTDVLAVVE